MSGKASWLIFVFPLLLSFHDNKPPELANDLAREYQQADRLYRDQNANESTYGIALFLFQSLLPKLEQSANFPGQDTLLFQTYLKKGILLEILQKNYKAASRCYRMAISLQKKNPDIGQESFFSALTYAGSCFYNLNNFDSANYYLRLAQDMISNIPQLPDKEFVFNTLGVLYYDNGNYQLSRNYFNHALDIIRARKRFDTAAAVSIETNIATSLYRMDQYDDAILIYKKILKYHKYSDFINMNLGRTFSAKGLFQEALDCFMKVNPKELPGVYNEMANAQMELHQTNAALHSLGMLEKAEESGTVNQLDIGINILYRAGMEISSGYDEAALTHLQKAIGIFSGHFHEEQIFNNPKDFTGTLTYYWLYDALLKKASCFESLYQKDRKTEDMVHALDVYQSILSLLSYIEKSYATDDAKTFLKKKSWEAYQKAFEVCLRLNELKPSGGYLELAFLISERNKASIVAAGLSERNMKGTGGAEEKWLQEERNIKYNIARLNVKSNQSQDAASLESIAKEKAGFEIELAELQKKIEKNDHYYKIKYNDVYPGVAEIQKQLGSEQAVIGFYGTTENLHAFIISSDKFEHIQIDSFSALSASIAEWLTALKSPQSGKKFEHSALGAKLSSHLIKPMQAALRGKEEWIIIPDGILCYLPFESLPGPDGQGYLLETTAISYQFSTKFLNNKKPQISRLTRKGSILALAPFAGKNSGSDFADEMESLPASANEIYGLSGKRLLGNEATKKAFLESMDKYPIIHLATHARSDVRNSAASFVAFYPAKGSKLEDNLYLEELYGLDMEKNRLMIISACETGQGELVANEGVISIARAFTYAGCPSVINSLWKADDQSTAAILNQFHYYLQKGFSKSKALQKAKLDYIKGNSLHRTPEYWSHLVLIGDADPIYSAKKTWLLVMAASGMLLAGFLLMTLKKEKKSTLS
ncbi:MAG: CHAT domain-containing protein [Chitinophagales bacterium]